ncbi:MAG TPA: glycoside hydrolase family 95 protein, partial [Acidobacteriota bacterium]|nr:glycoside hydrolase family 95 protein [Acidobacteriota bacterium]
MKLPAVALLLVGCASLAIAAPRDESRYVLLTAPGQHLFESSPLGNGRLGAAIYGGVAEERIVLNESGMWSGSPQDADRHDAHQALPEIRRLLLEGKNHEAEALVNANFTCAGKGSGFGAGANVPYGSYQTLGDLRLKFIGIDASAPFANYRRTLDLAEATARVSFEQGGVHFVREGFVSQPGEVFVLRLSADQKGKLSFDATLARRERATIESAGAAGLVMHGQLNDGYNGTDGVRYAARLEVRATGGTVNIAENTVCEAELALSDVMQGEIVV